MALKAHLHHLAMVKVLAMAVMAQFQDAMVQVTTADEALDAVLMPTAMDHTHPVTATVLATVLATVAVQEAHHHHRHTVLRSI